MKIFIVLVVCLVGTFAQTPSQKLKDTINSLREQMPCGFPTANIPPLAPYRGDSINLSHKLFILKINGSATDFIVWGLNDFDILNVNLDALTLTLNVDLNLKTIRAKGKYVVESFIVKLLRVRGRGEFDIQLSNTRVSTYARIGQAHGALRLIDLDIVLDVDTMKSKITGLLIGPLGSFFLSNFIDTAAVRYIKDNASAISENIREMIMPRVNEFLKEYTVQDMLDLLQNPLDMPQCIRTVT